MTDPRNADAFIDPQRIDASPERVDPTNDLVTRDDRHPRVGQLAIDDMQVRTADAARGHSNPNFARTG
jgi:hypothetical protein